MQSFRWLEGRANNLACSFPEAGQVCANRTQGVAYWQSVAFFILCRNCKLHLVGRKIHEAYSSEKLYTLKYTDA